MFKKKNVQNVCMLDEGEMLKRVTAVRVHNYYITLYNTPIQHVSYYHSHYLQCCSSALDGRNTKIVVNKFAMVPIIT